MPASINFFTTLSTLQKIAEDFAKETCKKDARYSFLKLHGIRLDGAKLLITFSAKVHQVSFDQTVEVPQERYAHLLEL